MKLFYSFANQNELFKNRFLGASFKVKVAETKKYYVIISHFLFICGGVGVGRGMEDSSSYVYTHHFKSHLLA